MTLNRTMIRLFVSMLAMLALCLSSGCEEDDKPTSDGGGGGAVEGEPCQRTADCAAKLVCSGGRTCERPGETGTNGKGDGCASNVDCQAEFVCASDKKCVDPGTGGDGDRCKGNEDCAAELLCSASLTCAKPGAPGTLGQGETCAATPDCALGLICLEEECTPLQFWPGVTCNEDTGAFRAYFEVPRGGQALSEFYRLPFPNDIRKKEGKVDVSGHPNPQIKLPKEYGDVVGEFFKRINADVTGWGLTTAVLARLSRTVDLKTLTVTGDSPTVQFFNIDKSSSQYGGGVGLFMFASTGKGKYICNNWVGVRPSVGAPLLPGTTYAVLLRKGIKDDKGAEAAQDDDFKAMVAATEPSDADLKKAWQAYAPLRAYLTDKAIDPATVLSAAVFTTMDPRARMSRFREVVRGEAAPTVDKLTLCDGQAKSPCDDGKEASHVCATSADAAFHELQGIYKTPVFQTGTAPYKTPADGGLIEYDGDGKPKVARQDDVCVAMTVPKATMPQNGWPVAIFAHGTGGSYRTFINNGTAKALADIKDGTNDLTKMAVISIDGSMHGPRRSSTDDPDELFFNLRNPAAARDNTYQGIADKFQLVRVIEGLDLASGNSPTGEAIKFDLSKIYFFGHSQGTIEGVPFVAYEPQVQAVVLSGAGGYLISSLLEKTKPVNVSAAVKFVLSEDQLGTTHPLLNLLQLYFEEVDTLHYGRPLFTQPLPDGGGGNLPARHTFLSYGVADSFTPPSTINALAKVMGIVLVDQSAERCGDGVCNGSEDCNSCKQDCTSSSNCGPFPPGFKTISAPVTGNVNAGGGKVTAAMVQYSGDGSYDDHHVLFQHADGRKQSVHFLGSAAAAADGIPTIPAP